MMMDEIKVCPQLQKHVCSEDAPKGLWSHWVKYLTKSPACRGLDAARYMRTRLCRPAPRA